MLDETTTMAALRSEGFLRRYWAKVQKSDGCWLWTGAHDAKGYGRIWLVCNVKLIITSRAAWMIEHGFIESIACVLHRCDNPPCVKPAHLFLGDRAANMRDCLDKGRFRAARGEAAGKSKLTEADVYEIRSRVADGATLRALAKEYGVGQTTIHYAAHGTTWRHLPAAQG